MKQENIRIGEIYVAPDENWDRWLLRKVAGRYC